jgi:hypothetical protein
MVKNAAGFAFCYRKGGNGLSKTDRLKLFDLSFEVGEFLFQPHGTGGGS